MKRYLVNAGILLLVSACQSPTQPDKVAAAAPTLSSGVDQQYIDSSVRIQDDFNSYVNGNWLKKTEIPADKSRWGAFSELQESTLAQLHDIIDNAATGASKNEPGDAKKIGDLYNSFMDEAALETLGTKPLDPVFEKISTLNDKKQIPALIAYLNRISVTTPYNIYVHQDAKDSTKYIVDIGQSGLGLPDRDYYLKDDDAKLKGVRIQYQAHIEKILTLAGDKSASDSAKKIIALETAIAKVQWTKVQNRDPVKTYNPVAIPALKKLTPDYSWNSYLTESGIENKVSYLVISQPSYLSGFNSILKTTPISVWKTYFRWHLLSDYAPYLPKAYADENFAFYGTVLRGIPQPEVRWKRAVKLTESSIGEVLGKLYVATYFPPTHKARMEKLVGNLLIAYRESIDTLDWMSPETKKEAQAKLATFNPKIGYPNKWIDYSTLTIDKNDLVGNVQRANIFEFDRNMNKLGKPIDRDEWGMTPQTINAYYNPELNEIVFPAAILQAPFFNINADDAINYGAIGAVIGHEISHGFDDQGAQYDGLGNLRDWWTTSDHEKFAAKTSALVKQYSSFSPLPGYPINGELTLGENIADNSGLAIAYKAYLLSLNGKPAPVIDNYTGVQRFYIGFGQIWRNKMRDQETMVRIKTDPHSPPEFRVMGTLQNQAGFYQAFDVKSGDKMFIPADQRVVIW